ncbi:MAG: hypothetical protein IJO87_05985 [Eggerthellaceae bacterium]|nr:hypothetical protein [Eggerthellaceae bacterium]
MIALPKGFLFEFVKRPVDKGRGGGQLGFHEKFVDDGACARRKLKLARDFLVFGRLAAFQVDFEEAVDFLWIVRLRSRPTPKKAHGLRGRVSGLRERGVASGFQVFADSCVHLDGWHTLPPIFR